MATVYKSKIDVWIALIILFVVVFSLISALQQLSAYSPYAKWNALIIAAAGMGIPLWLLLATRYIITEDQLLVRSGPFRWRIPISEISGITSTYSPFSSPALSIRRLRIEYGDHKSVLISPRDRDNFIRQIESLQIGAV